MLLEAYRRNPELYARDVLKVHWYRQQAEIAEALITHKRVLVKAGNGPGKTFLAAGLVNWFFDSFIPSVCITTAPTALQVKDALWKNVRTLRRGRPGLQPKAPRMETAPDHFAVGMTAFSADAFQGRHEENVLIVFDEATGIEGAFWDAAEGMLTSERCYMLAILNPTDTASRAYQEEQSGLWYVIELSTLDHPNILAALEGKPIPIRGAVQLEWVEKRIKDPEWCTPVNAGEAQAGDFEFPPRSGRWYRPGGEFEARVLGRWPSLGSSGVWSDALWQACLGKQFPKAEDAIEIGCDVARKGDDNTEMVVRRGPCAIHHEAHNGWLTSQTAGRLKELCRQFAGDAAARYVAVKVDDDGVGGGVVDQADGYTFIPISAASKALEEERYPNKRSELWFGAAQRARRGGIDVTRLSEDSRRKLRTQLMAPTWKLDSAGRRVVEPKDDTKKRIGRSPDSADAFNLAFYSAGTWEEAREAMVSPSAATRRSLDYEPAAFDEEAESGSSIW